MNDHEQLAREVIRELRDYRRRLDELITILEGKHGVSEEQHDELQALLTSLKADLKAAARGGRVCNSSGPPSQIEQAFFAPTLQKAAANLRVAVNSHPIRSDWFSCLYEVRWDIDHPLHQLEEKYPNVTP
jgi:hypothetical protein